MVQSKPPSDSLWERIFHYLTLSYDLNFLHSSLERLEEKSGSCINFYSSCFKATLVTFLGDFLVPIITLIHSLVNGCFILICKADKVVPKISKEGIPMKILYGEWTSTIKYLNLIIF